VYTWRTCQVFVHNANAQVMATTHSNKQVSHRQSITWRVCITIRTTVLGKVSIPDTENQSRDSSWRWASCYHTDAAGSCALPQRQITFVAFAGDKEQLGMPVHIRHICELHLLKCEMQPKFQKYCVHMLH